MRIRKHSRLARRLAGLVAVAACLSVSHGPAAATDKDTVRLYVTLDKAQLVVLPQEPVSKVLLANPSIADVQVVTPTQLLITGKAAGVTSLHLFYSKRVQLFDLVVHPGPLGRSTTVQPNAEPHGVLVHRADKMSESIFVRDREQWLELGGVKPEQPEAAKK